MQRLLQVQFATYEWFLGGVSQGAPAPGNTFNATVAGTYTVTATSAAGCPTTSAPFVVTLPTYTITATAGPNGTISPSGSVVVNCGDNQTFTITPNGGFAIQDVVVDGVPQGPIGTYTFTNVTANGHTISATFFIAGCPVPPTANAGANASFCANQTYTLNGAVGGSATAGSWSGGTGTYNPNANTLNAIYTPSAAEITAGTVTLTLTSNNPNGAPCVPSTSSVTLTIKEVPVVSISGILGFCASGSTTLTANATINPAGPITYQWNYNPGNISLGTALTQTSSQGAGTYSVTATGNGCSNSASEIVALFASPTVSISGSNLICTGTPTTLSAIAAAGSGVISSYQWKLGGVDIGGATSPTFATTLPGNYTLQVTNSNGCSTTSAVHVLTVDNSPLNGNYTIGAGPASCTNYISFASAINDLNTRTISGNVRFDVAAGYTETVPVGGLALGSVALNATVAGRTISFLKNGVGANPLLSSYTGGTATPSTNASDGIFSLRGVDNVSIDGIDLLDVNTTNPATMEYGYGLFKLSASDGAQNNTITNCTITLNRVNNGSNVLPMFEGSTGIAVINATATAAVTGLTPTGAAGTNSNNKFYSNTIVNCNNGIGLSGFAAASPFTLGDTGNDVGGTSVAEGNNILNFGGGGTQAAAGIRANNQWGVNISFNTINNNNGSGVNHTGTIRGIYGQAGTSANASINNNNIDIKGGGTTQIIYGIDNSIGSTAASNTITINNNTITAAYSTVTSGGITAIINNATPSTLNMSGNTVQNITQGGTGPFVAISNNAIVATVAMNDNIFTGNTITSTGAFTGIATISGATNLSMNGNTITSNTKTNGTATTLFLLNANASTNSTINNNTITGNTVIASATNMELAAINQGLSVYTANNNFISTNAITGVAGAAIMTVTGYRNVSAAVNETVTNNTIRKLFITGASTGLQVIQGINLNTGAASVKTISGNNIDSLYTGSGLSATIYGIRNATGTTVNIFRNKIHSLHPGQSATAGSYAAGIRLTSGTGNIYNNMIGLDYSKAFAPAANSVVTNADGLKGIEFTGTVGTWNIYYNSIHLKGAGGAGFGSSAIGQTAATSPTLNLRNNILDNQATPNGGRAVAFRRGTNSLVTYATTSNNNSFYAGTASANNLLYFDGTNAPQTIVAYQGIAGMSPRETASIASTTAFVDPPYDLHLDPANNCDKDASGAAIPGYTTDYDGDTRNATAPDMGCDEFDPTGAGSPIWKGVNTDWTDVVNWCGAVPISTTNVSIPAGRSNYPTITTNTPVCGNINIASGGSVTITGVGQLAIYGTITNAGTFNVADGTIEMAGSSAQTIPASAFVGNNIKNLIINNATVNLGGALNLTGKLSFTGSNRTFATAGNLTLKSSATATASVGDITNNGTNTGNQITGDVLVERHIMAVRAWRLLSPPTQHNLQTIKEAWQENQTANATTPAGFGIQITSDRASWSTDGFDLSTPAGSSVKTYNPATNQYVGIVSTVNVVAPTPSNGRFEQGKAYMTFIRGDRTVNTFPQAPTTTVLREKGALITNNFVFPGGVGAGQFAAVGNPYASAIDFSKVFPDATNIQNVYYLWDPQLGTLGGYRTFSGPSYNPVPPGGSYTSNKFIESGSGFFVHSSGSAGTVTLKETHKVDGSNLVTRTNNGPQKLLYTNLYQVSNGTSKLFDGVLNEYDPSYADAIDDQDGIKLNNFRRNTRINSR
ncbi:MAG: PKD domain-containing protein [Ferruginibacter sp.]